MNVLLLAAGVAGSTGFWIVNRWAGRMGARTEAYSFWLLLCSALFSAPLACIFLAIPRIGAETVFPFVIASPIILMLLAGHLIFHERITRPALIGCLLGTGGLILLAVGR